MVLVEDHEYVYEAPGLMVTTGPSEPLILISAVRDEEPPDGADPRLTTTESDTFVTPLVHVMERVVGVVVDGYHG